jgi:DNA-binding response OmpR family regulator
MTEHLDRLPALDLVLDHDRHRATRGAGLFVELGGHVRLWQLLTALARRYDRYYRTYDLIDAAWEGYRAQEGTLWWAVSELRTLLRPLGLGIRFTRGIGYRLQDIRGR